MRNLFKGMIFVAVSIFFFTAPIARADDLTLYFISAPERIDWSRPDRVFKTTFRNILAQEKEKKEVPFELAGAQRAGHTISHVDVRVRCEGQEDIFTGMTSESEYAGLDMLLANAGFEIVLTAQKGRFVTPEEIRNGVTLYQANGRLSFLQIDISPSTCRRLSEYHREYTERGYQNVFGGLQHRPRKGEGSGCAAYGMSYMQIAGLLTPELDRRWSHKLLIPNDLIGSQGKPARLGFYDYVLLRRKAKWAKPSEPHLALEFWDPQLMHDWVVETWKARPENADYEYLRVNNSVGIRMDRRHVATPTEPFWQL